MASRKYTEDYELVTTTDSMGREKKSAVYRGTYFETDLDQASLLKFKRLCMLLTALIIILQIGSGFIANPGMNNFYVAIPFAFSFFPLVYLADSVLRLPKAKRPLRRDEVAFSFDRIKVTGIILGIFIIAGIIGEIIFLILVTGEKNPVSELLYISLQAVSAASAFIILQMRQRIEILPIGTQTSTETPD